MIKEFMNSHIGELAALTTAICWTFNAIAFESAGKKVGSLSVNYLRLFVAFSLLSICSFLTRGLALPIDATRHNWFWLLISGLIGYVLGDLFLFEAYVQIGSRISLLILSLAPPIAALAGFLLMGERISLLNLTGMFIVIIGIGLVILSRNPVEKKVGFNRPVKGLFYAALGALGQAFGLTCSKFGIGVYNAMAATQIRLIAAIIGFTVIITVRDRWPEIRAAVNHREAIGKNSRRRRIRPLYRSYHVPGGFAAYRHRHCIVYYFHHAGDYHPCFDNFLKGKSPSQRSIGRLYFSGGCYLAIPVGKSSCGWACFLCKT